MNIRKLKIEHFGSIQCFEAVFHSDLIVLRGVYSDQVALAIKFLIGGRLSKRVVGLFSQATRLYAEVECDDVYCVEIAAQKPGALHYVVYKHSDRLDCTDEYLGLIKQSPEEEVFNSFSALEKCNYPYRLKQYKDIEKYYPDNKFDELTDGVGKTRVFRAALNRFIRDFKPEKLRADKEYWLALNSKGEFQVVHPSFDANESHALSETEEVLYQYLCFLHLSEFWSEVEKIRNLNRVNKPLIVTDLMERIDYTVDPTSYIERTRILGRQLFLVFPCTEENLHISQIQNAQVVNIGGYYG